MRTIVYFVAALIVTVNTSFAAPLISNLSNQELDELKIYRENFPMMQKRLGEAEANAIENSEVRAAHQKYLVNYYQNEELLVQLRVKIFTWQIFAANVVLALVIFLCISGIVFSGFQLWHSVKRPKSVSSSIELEISEQKFRLQSGVIGLTVLVFSGIFLVFFVREIYKIELIPNNSTPAISVGQK